MIATKLTGLQHGQIELIKESVCVGNLVKIVRDPEWDKPEGKAYKAICKDVKIGYVPLLSTLRGYWKDADTQTKRDRINEWGVATSKIREWLESREKFHFETEWNTKICMMLYWENGEQVARETKDIAAVSVMFEEVE